MFYRIVQTCLRTFCRSQANYKDIRASGSFGRLPSPSLLNKYKSKVEQNPGINCELLSWMASEAGKRHKSGTMYGGVIFDETAIQVSVLLLVCCIS